jgi:hypothetical protein
LVPFLVFFGSQEAVKKFGPKIGFLLNWSSHPSGIPTVKANILNDGTTITVLKQ